MDYIFYQYGKTPLELAELEEKSECIQLLQNALVREIFNYMLLSCAHDISHFSHSKHHLSF